ncbi:hypothetical protein F5884DRAFT_456263 [Xylogone sp. PMI_703]|nr:hypothetical protein F5884DRAFT_456263 [Xylogone sp. PMI_703]
MSATQVREANEGIVTPPSVYNDNQGCSAVTHTTNMSPYGSPTPKSVAFELLFPESPQYRARLPMRVQIFPHDTTESIVTTVKNFYGLYAGPGGSKGVSFEDEQGNTLIARYENLRNNMTVYVRVIEEPAGAYSSSYHTGSPGNHHSYYHLDSHYLPQHPAQALTYGQPDSRPTSRTSRKRSVSPNQGRGRRSTSASTNPLPSKKSRSRSGFKSRGSSAHGSFADIHSDGLGYSSGDGGPGSVSSRTKSEQLGNTEISLDNIVEGGRRKRAKFESSELPLFAPPQMPAAASNSSVSPARRNEYQRAPIPFTHTSQHAFWNAQQLQSPHSYNNGYGQPGLYATPAANGRRTRGGASYPSGQDSLGSTPNGNSSGILPTPDPTVRSCMSEEDKDVALQLMRLGEMSNISHGRTSASTLDDTFSGRADAASSTGATSEADSESELDLPPPRQIKREASPILPPSMAKKSRPHLDDILPSQDTTEPSGDEGDYEDGQDQTFSPDMNGPEAVKSKNSRQRASHTVNKSRANVLVTKVTKATSKSTKTQRPGLGLKVKKPATSSNINKGPISPASLPPQSRKASVSSALNFHHQLGEEEEDLSTKPRCQRCRKSKKGCDRQRPCQRCKDAGLNADQCISEDEGNGRKGRYGRHMGVPVRKDEAQTQINVAPPVAVSGAQGGADKSKKRKR